MSSNDELIKIIHDDVKQIKDDMVQVKVTNAVQNQQLGEHMRRTENLEKRMAKIDLIKWITGAIITLSAAYAKYQGMF